VKAYVPKDEDGHDLTPPETVHSEQVQNDNRGVKTLTVGNDKGEYVLVCDVKESTCLTPDPGRDFMSSRRPLNGSLQVRRDT